MSWGGFVFLLFTLFSVYLWVHSAAQVEVWGLHWWPSAWEGQIFPPLTSKSSTHLFLCVEGLLFTSTETWSFGEGSFIWKVAVPISADSQQGKPADTASVKQFPSPHHPGGRMNFFPEEWTETWARIACFLPFWVLGAKCLCWQSAPLIWGHWTWKWSNF